MKKYRNIIATVILGVLIIPQITFAAWWNPFTWKIFSSPNKTPQVVIQTPRPRSTTTVAVVLSTSTPVKIKTVSQIQPTTNIVMPPTPSIPAQTQPSPNTQTVNLPNGAVVETDVNGNIIRYIKDAPQVQQPDQTIQSQTDDKNVGVNYYNQNKTCVGLSGARYSYCVSYAFSPEIQASQQTAQQQSQTQQAQVNANTRYQAQLQAVQTKILPLQKQEKQLDLAFSTKCSSFSPLSGTAGAQCELIGGQTQAITEYIGVILSDFLTPVSDLSIEYENKLDDLSGKIFQIKMSYRQAVANTETSGGDLSLQNGQIQNLTNAANNQIQTLNQEKKTVLLEYQLKLSQ